MQGNRNFGIRYLALFFAAALGMLLGLCFPWVIGSTSAAAAESVLHFMCSHTNLKGICTDGATPFVGLIGDGKGNLYGTTYTGGTSNLGTVFKISATGTYTVLHSFNWSDGDGSFAPLIRDSKGNLYGTTYAGGATGAGVVFKRSVAGLYTVLHSFLQEGDGQGPSGTLYLDSSGNLYGTTILGGASNAGTIFKLSHAGNLTVLYSFCSQAGCSDGITPYGGVVADASGNLYGTASVGGTVTSACSDGCGVLFKLATDGTYTVLHTFTGYPSDGANSYGPLYIDRNGNLYGATEQGGTPSSLCVNGPGCGTVFELSAGGTYSVLYSFCSVTNCSDGVYPLGGVIADANGNLYGTAAGGSLTTACPTGCGVVFGLSGRTETVLYAFAGQPRDGQSTSYVTPFADSSGNLYGTTLYGGPTRPRKCGGNGCGTVFKLTGTGFVP